VSGDGETEGEGTSASVQKLLQCLEWVYDAALKRGPRRRRCGRSGAELQRAALRRRRWGAGLGSSSSRLSQCSLQGRIEDAEKPGAVSLSQRGRSTSIRSELPEVPRYLATDECVPDIRLRPLFSGMRDDARPFLSAAGAGMDR